jgi:hypothetical protein
MFQLRSTEPSAELLFALYLRSKWLMLSLRLKS